MKKLLIVLGLATFSLGYSQGGTLVVNNYTPYDYYGAIIAHNFAGGCYPYVSSKDPNMITVPANANMSTGTELRYDNYRDQYTSSLYPVTEWNVSLSATAGPPRLWNHPAVMPGSPVSNNTRWGATKFQMRIAGTTTNAPDNFNANLSVAGNSCYLAPDYFTTPSGSNSAEMFMISSGGINYTYINLY
ncbi:hypothetical protein HHL23_11515 [Chryseobacterium sp. RP-3-3]|uniref:Uncharacterized protein n=1 Tax=Chryseobacterium antibioticum TaxID=2728847 RepID=A0A7Y0FS96_9FLAO|nr:hypothetical protein [Chryseobacterium antibioticum]NML70426.1 hypothetical protein [Chryseobacterium antibioticum]